MLLIFDNIKNIPDYIKVIGLEKAICLNYYEPERFTSNILPTSSNKSYLSTYYKL